MTEVKAGDKGQPIDKPSSLKQKGRGELPGAFADIFTLLKYKGSCTWTLTSQSQRLETDYTFLSLGFRPGF